MSYSTINCNTCDQEMRTESLLSHIINNHPTYFWDDIFSFQTVDGVMELRINSKYQLKEAFSLLDSNSPYKVDDDIFTDFGGNKSYKKSETAMNHIQKHSDKHVHKYIDALKQGLNSDNLKQLLQFIMNKPVKVIEDEKEVQRRVRDEMANEKAKFENEMSALRIENHKAQYFMGRDEVKMIEEQKKYIERLLKENAELRNNNYKLNEKLSEYNTIYIESQKEMRESLKKESEELSWYEKLKKQLTLENKKLQDNCDTKLKKMEEDNDKKIKKIKEQMTEQTEKYDKKEIKYKKEIKKLQHEIKALKLRSKSDSSDSTDDTRDNDSD